MLMSVAAPVGGLRNDLDALQPCFEQRPWPWAGPGSGGCSPWGWKSAECNGKDSLPPLASSSGPLLVFPLSSCPIARP